ncbi:hypothetical protein B0H19DRAFT_9862 [Mycena capillaripes]|nr:hypothetical protein B0H19DRAFT_9862 [Mycena capillaripes]
MCPRKHKNRWCDPGHTGVSRSSFRCTQHCPKLWTHCRGDRGRIYARRRLVCLQGGDSGGPAHSYISPLQRHPPPPLRSSRDPHGARARVDGFRDDRLDSKRSVQGLFNIRRLQEVLPCLQRKPYGVKSISFPQRESVLACDNMQCGKIAAKPNSNNALIVRCTIARRDAKLWTGTVGGIAFLARDAGGFASLTRVLCRSEECRSCGFFFTRRTRTQRPPFCFRKSTICGNCLPPNS